MGNATVDIRLPNMEMDEPAIKARNGQVPDRRTRIVRDLAMSVARALATRRVASSLSPLSDPIASGSTRVRLPEPAALVATLAVSSQDKGEDSPTPVSVRWTDRCATMQVRNDSAGGFNLPLTVPCSGGSYPI
jgi:hypothetical protein